MSNVRTLKLLALKEKLSDLVSTDSRVLLWPKAARKPFVVMVQMSWTASKKEFLDEAGHLIATDAAFDAAYWATSANARVEANRRVALADKHYANQVQTFCCLPAQELKAQLKSRLPE